MMDTDGGMQFNSVLYLLLASLILFMKITYLCAAAVLTTTLKVLMLSSSRTPSKFAEVVVIFCSFVVIFCSNDSYIIVVVIFFCGCEASIFISEFMMRVSYQLGCSLLSVWFGSPSLSNLFMDLHNVEVVQVLTRQSSDVGLTRLYTSVYLLVDIVF